MILARLLRPQLPLRAVHRCSHLTATATTRALHQVPKLPNVEQSFIELGIPELLSPLGFKTAWTDYQRLMISSLNKKVEGTPLGNMSTKDVVVKTARDPKFAATFNHASMAFNNHFFFQTICDRQMDILPELKQSLLKSFSSIELFKKEFLATADAMFGPGFVWLVWHRPAGQMVSKGSWKILPTYLAGSPLWDAHWRQQPVDMNTQSSSAGLNGIDHARQTRVQNRAGFAGEYSADQADPSNAANRAPGGANITPILCVNTWQHVWVPDWGIDGKRDFLEAWWERIDWSNVQSLAPKGVLDPNQSPYAA